VPHYLIRVRVGCVALAARSLEDFPSKRGELDAGSDDHDQRGHHGDRLQDAAKGADRIALSVLGRDPGYRHDRDSGDGVRHRQRPQLGAIQPRLGVPERDGGEHTGAY